MRPEVEEVLRSPRRGRPKLQQHKEGEGAEEDDGTAPPRYDCAFQDEEDGGFAPPQMVWCKVRSHPWWPAQVFDAADASEDALRHAKSGGGAPLVAYFWDKTFAWSDPSMLLPFRANFPRLAGQNTVFNYVSAVDAALEEVERRVEAGLSCPCFPNAKKRQEVQNSGIREGAYGAVVDDVYMRDTFRAQPFLEYISALGRNPLAGADHLDLATAKAQLRSFNRLRVPRELAEFVTYDGIEDVTEATPQTKRKRIEKTSEDDVPSKEKKPRRAESSLRKSGAAKEEAIAEDLGDVTVPRKSSARKKTSKDMNKRESPAIKKDAIVEDSSKQSKSKISKSSAEKKKKDSSKDIDKGESPPELAGEDAANEGSSMPSGEETDGKLSKGRKSKISKSSAKTKKKDISKDIDKKESVPEPAEEDTEDSNMPSEGATDGTLSKGRKSKISTSSAKMKKKDVSQDADKKESLPEPALEDATNEDSSMLSGEATDGTLVKGRKSKTSKHSTKTKKEDISKDADKKKSLPDPAKEEATGDDSSTPGATDDTLSKKRKSKIRKSPVKKKKQDTSKDTDEVEMVGGSKTPVKKTVDVILTESKSARRLRSMRETEGASEGPRKDDVGDTTKGKDKDDALLKENNLGRRASSARQDKITVDGDELADSSVKDSVSPVKKKAQLGETLATKDAPIAISEHGRKRKKLSELMVETGTPNRSPGGKSKARGKRPLPVSTEKPDHDTEDTVKTRGKRSLPSLTEKPEVPDHDTKDTVKTRGKRSLPASTEKPEDPDRDTKDTVKTRGKRSLPESTEEPEDPDRERDTKDTMKTRKRKKLDTLGDLSSQSQPLSPKRPTKVREATPKAAGKKSQASPAVKANGETLGNSSSQPQLSPRRSTKAREATRKAAEVKPHSSPAEVKPHTSPAEVKPHTSPAVKANREASQTRSRRTKSSEETVLDKSPRSVKPSKGKQGAATEDSLSCGEMHSQLRVAASDLKKVGKITPASVSFFTEFGKSSCPSSFDVEKEIPIEAANTDSYASSPRANEEMPEEAANKVASPPADEEIPEKAANKVASLPADEEIPEKAANKIIEEEIPEKLANKVASPHTEEIPEKVANSEPSPSELPVADHMKDDYWSDILINVEEPISSLKKKKDKSTISKNNELQAEDAAKEPPVSAGNVEVEEPKAAEPKQDNAENGKAKAKPPSVANGGQPKEVTVENPSLTGLVLHFSRPDSVPSHSDLIKIFSQYGPVSEARTQTGNTTNSATVIFKRRMDAEGAFGSAGKMTNVLGPGLASFRLADFPCSGAAASGNGAQQGASN
jgi:hypothetical protein